VFLRNEDRSAETAGRGEGVRRGEKWWSKVRGVGGLSKPCHFCSPIVSVSKKQKIGVQKLYRVLRGI
jgi:PHP family Zn ribbon phosphoesterase